MYERWSRLSNASNDRKEVTGTHQTQGFVVRRTSKGHYVVVNPRTGLDTDGRFAVGHGKNKGMVLAPYVKNVLKTIGLDK